MNDSRRLLGLGLAALVLSAGYASLATHGQAPPRPTPDQVEFFEKRIRPLLDSKCLGCHNADVQMGKLRLDSREAMMKGGVSGPAIEPGRPDQSLLIEAVRQEGDLKMPKGGRLSDPEITDLEAWVKMGAPWPEGPTCDPKANLWSLVPVRKPPLPKVKNARAILNPIDAFVLAKLETKGLGLASAADRRTLLRRLSFDLIGLPPNPAEVEAFLADKAPDAYERAVDRLLASPHYGERWARLWMDVARYADTKGYVFEEDRVYHHAYTYRDWLIRAFNEDMPYDKFILEQLAADRLPEVQAGDDKTPLAALGFLTLGRRFLNNQPDIIDDRIDVTMRGFQGLTVGCARCHDHKFDPIPTQDYYSLYAVFASSMEKLSPISPKAIREPWEEFNGRVGSLEAEIRRLIVAQTKALREKLKSPEDGKDLAVEVKQTLQALREEVVPEGENLKKLRSAFDPGENQRLGKLMQEVAELRKSAPKTPEFAMAMIDGPKPSDGVVFRRGVPGSNGGPAPRRFLLALAKPGGVREHWTSGSGRLELARAIASKENPLTARVLVNRIWRHHFGEGIVRTPSDFGHQGEPPTDPELLDYLAAAFMENGWSIKKLHRLIVTSAAYRQSSVASPAAMRIDPDNRLWSRMNRRRLDLEQMRDAMMAASGRLDLARVGGKSVDLWAEPFTPRRAVYGFIERQNLPGIFRTFDLASPDSTSPRRFETTVPQQALFFMNSPFSADQARAVGDREELKSAADDSQRVKRLYRLLFARPPDVDELASGVAYLKGPAPAPPAPPWRYGYGEFDPATGRVVSFNPLPQFVEGSYRGGATLPDPKLGWLMLNAAGGHPGHDGTRAVIRRWAAPAAMTVSLGGLLKHPNAQGDGVRARAVSSRSGLLGEWRAHNGEARTNVAEVRVEKGDTLDFLVDAVGEESFDSFLWAPQLRVRASGEIWDSARQFGPPPGPPLSRLALYAQALMMSNEFLFVD